MTASQKPAAVVISISKQPASALTHEDDDVERAKALNQEKSTLLARKINDRERLVRQEASALNTLKQELAVLEKDLVCSVFFFPSQLFLFQLP